MRAPGVHRRCGGGLHVPIRADLPDVLRELPGNIYPTGQDPFAPAATPYVEFDCSYLNGYLYKRVPLP